MSCSNVYQQKRKEGWDELSAHMAAAAAYEEHHPDEPDGCYWCGSLNHHSSSCMNRDEESFFD